MLFEIVLSLEIMLFLLFKRMLSLLLLPYIKLLVTRDEASRFLFILLLLVQFWISYGEFLELSLCDKMYILSFLDIQLIWSDKLNV